MKKFIIPSGSFESAQLHITRTVCRRAERVVVALSRKQKINGQIIVFLNRLSDLFFVLARVANKKSEIKEKEWK